jgi:hypothetical protein
MEHLHALWDTINHWGDQQPLVTKLNQLGRAIGERSRTRRRERATARVEHLINQYPGTSEIQSLLQAYATHTQSYRFDQHPTEANKVQALSQLHAAAREIQELEDKQAEATLHQISHVLLIY